jgi:exonuclease SbcD
MPPVRLLHIADLHAGRTYDRRLNRNEDLQYSLNQILDYLSENRIDYLLVAGDIFDKKMPDAESQELIAEFFIRVKELGTGVIAIAGNHDGSSFLKSQQPWLKRFGIKVFHKFDRQNAVYTEGDIAFVGVPFISERLITEITPRGEEEKLTYGERIGKLLLWLGEQVKNYRYKVLITHLFFADTKVGKSEIEITVADTYAVPQGYIPEVFDYAALGHVHRYQRLEKAKVPAYYTGSLYQLDFGEEGDKKYFNVITLDETGTTVEREELSLLRELKTLTLKADTPERYLESLKNRRTYYRIFVEANTPKEFLLFKQKAERVLGEYLLRIYPKDFQQRVKTIFKEQKRESINLKNPIEVYKAYCISMGRSVDAETEKTLKEMVEKLLTEN